MYNFWTTGIWEGRMVNGYTFPDLRYGTNVRWVMLGGLAGGRGQRADRRAEGAHEGGQRVSGAARQGQAAPAGPGGGREGRGRGAGGRRKELFPRQGGQGLPRRLLAGPSQGQEEGERRPGLPAKAMGAHLEWPHQGMRTEPRPAAFRPESAASFPLSAIIKAASQSDINRGSAIVNSRKYNVAEQHGLTVAIA
eukprot:scaffold123535_cov39-Prasinocladus_malaysianus.AAC.2